MQDRAGREGRRIHELVTPVEPDKGLAALPEPSAGDVFFDMEGDAFAADGGLEYLFGAADRHGGYDADWALTIDLKRGRNSPVPHPAALVPLDIVNDRVLRESLAGRRVHQLRAGRPAKGGLRPAATGAAAPGAAGRSVGFRTSAG